MKKILKFLAITCVVVGFTQNNSAGRGSKKNIDKSLVQIREASRQLESAVQCIHELVKLVSKRGKAISGKSARKALLKKVSGNAFGIVDGLAGTCSESVKELDKIARDAVSGIVDGVVKEVAIASQRVAQTASKTTNNGAAQLIKTALRMHKLGKTLSVA